jgi:uncharacterized protein
VKPFDVNVADLMHRPGARRRVEISGRLNGLKIVGTTVPDEAEVEVNALLEWVSDGVLATGDVRTTWAAECRRCLGPVTGEADVEFRELFALPGEGDDDTYPLRHDHVDLGRLARETLLGALPLAPVCRPDCKGLCPTCGADRNNSPCDCAESEPDPRWAALDVLRAAEEPSSRPD